MSRAHGSPLAAVAGTVAPGFEPVREAFAEVVASQHRRPPARRSPPPSTAGWWSTCGRDDRRRRHALAGGHAVRAVLGHQGRGGDRRCCGWPTAASCASTDRVADHWPEFARQRQGRHHGRPAVRARGRAALDRPGGWTPASAATCRGWRRCWRRRRRWSRWAGPATTRSPSAGCPTGSPRRVARSPDRRAGGEALAGAARARPADRPAATTPPRPAGWRGCTAARTTR